MAVFAVISEGITPGRVARLGDLYDDASDHYRAALAGGDIEALGYHATNGLNVQRPAEGKFNETAAQVSEQIGKWQRMQVEPGRSPQNVDSLKQLISELAAAWSKTQQQRAQAAQLSGQVRSRLAGVQDPRAQQLAGWFGSVGLATSMTGGSSIAIVAAIILAALVLGRR